jgi:20S proteasome subunit beta 6
MAAMFSQNPVMNGPNYSFNQSAAPSSAADGYRQHRFDPYVLSFLGHCLN